MLHTFAVTSSGRRSRWTSCVIMLTTCGLALLGTAALSCWAEEPPFLTVSRHVEPRINGPSVFGVRPGSPLLYTIPATGERPMQFSVEGLPAGCRESARPAGSPARSRSRASISVVLRAENCARRGGEEVPHRRGRQHLPDAAAGLEQLELLGRSRGSGQGAPFRPGHGRPGLIEHGWTYVNIDDTWQGQRGGPFKASRATKSSPT